MNLEKKIYYIISIIFLFSSVYAQHINRWHQIESTDIKTTLLDTTTVKKTNDQLSVWILEIYNEPFSTNNSETLVKRSRTQYIFNLIKNEYSVIGNLYYDVMGRIISQNYELRIGGIGRNFYKPIYDDPAISDLYVKITNFLNINIFPSQIEHQESNSIVKSDEVILEPMAEEIDLPAKETFDKTINLQDIEPESSNFPETINPNDETVDSAITVFESEAEEIAESDEGVLDIPNDIAEIIDLPSTNDIRLETKNTSTNIDSSSLKDEITNRPYDYESEFNVTQTIFSDGTKYCFQVSSWKRKSVAESEKNKLISAGHNAFLVAAEPKHKRGTWYRVRIGFFNSLSEAKDYQKSLK